MTARTLGELREAEKAGKLSQSDAKLLADLNAAVLKAVAPFRHPSVLNLTEGRRNSVDPKQREAFESLFNLLRDVPIRDAIPALGALQRAKKKAGRKPGSKIDDREVLKKMTPLVGGGTSVPKAARIFAAVAPGSGTLKSTAKRLERKFRIGILIGR
jgi:hypothetical protein